MRRQRSSRPRLHRYYGTLCISAACLSALLMAMAGCQIQALDARLSTRAPLGSFSAVDKGAAAREGEGAYTRGPQPVLASLGNEWQQVAAQQRVVIYNAGFSVVVREIDAAIEEMRARAEMIGGYVDQISGPQITIRVPVARFQETVEFVGKLGQITRRDVQALDVTEEYVDLEARLRNAQTVRKRLEALLEKAEDVKAALEVERELKRLGEEIEQLTAKLELIRNRVAFSTIRVSFDRVARQPPAPLAMRLPFHWLTELDAVRLLNH